MRYFLLLFLVSGLAFGEELRFERFDGDGFSRGTVRPWGHDAYKIEEFGDRGFRETIIRVPKRRYEGWHERKRRGVYERRN